MDLEPLVEQPRHQCRLPRTRGTDGNEPLPSPGGAAGMNLRVVGERFDGDLMHAFYEEIRRGACLSALCERSSVLSQIVAVLPPPGLESMSATDWKPLPRVRQNVLEGGDQLVAVCD